MARHHPITIALHWAIALLVIVLAGLGIVLARVRFHTTTFDTLHYWHRSLGELAFLVVVANLWWRRRRRPAPAATQPRWRAAAAHFVQAAILALLVFVPAAKLARGTFGLGWVFFGLSVGAPLPPNAVAGRWLSAAHDFGALTLLGLCGLHSVAALWHGVVLKDDVLSRMSPLPGR